MDALSTRGRSCRIRLPVGSDCIRRCIDCRATCPVTSPKAATASARVGSANAVVAEWMATPTRSRGVRPEANSGCDDDDDDESEPDDEPTSRAGRGEPYHGSASEDPAPNWREAVEVRPRRHVAWRHRRLLIAFVLVQFNNCNKQQAMWNVEVEKHVKSVFPSSVTCSKSKSAPFFTGKMSASRRATLLVRRAAVALSSRSAVPAASSTQAVRYFGKWRSLGFWHERRHLEGALSYRGNYRHADAYACTYSTLFSSRCPFLLSLWCWNILIGNNIWMA